jgi:hypothetical protein
VPQTKECIFIPFFFNIFTISDAPLNSLMDSIASPKVKTSEGKKVGARSLAVTL